MKAMKYLALLLCLLLLTGCSAPASPLNAAATPVPGTDPRLPEAAADPSLATEKEALLYFRYHTEPYLAAESRVITHSPAEPYELALVTALLSGPTPQNAELTPLFPTGAHVISTARQGRTLFITLSREILNGYPDEPAAWQADPYWAQEAPLRRRLCMQSLVAAVTENCDVDDVQILVEQAGADMGSLRLRQQYFLITEDSSLLVPPLTRDESLLLTPGNALGAILSLWQQQDWQRLYLYIAATDPATGEERRSYTDFVTAMENLPRLAETSFSGGSVSMDGRWAAYTLDAVTLSNDMRQTAHTGRTLRLLRENGLWKITLSQLTDWLEVGA